MQALNQVPATAAAQHPPPRPEIAGSDCLERTYSLGKLRLEHGHTLDNVQLAVNLYGHNPANSQHSKPVFLVLGGISANRIIANTATHKGWWRNIAGPGAALDTDQIGLIGIDFLGSGGSSKPAEPDQYLISPADQAHAIARALDQLNIKTLTGIIGSSYGGSVALAFAHHYPQKVSQVLLLCAAHRACTLTSAYRSIQRNIVRLAAANGQEQAGLKLARQLAMLGFRSREEINHRFAQPVELKGQRLRLPVESYLNARGSDWATTTSAAEFICLSQSCDLLNLQPQDIPIPLWLAGARNDAIVPFEDIQTLARGVPNLQRLTELNTRAGHDAFLVETAQVSRLVNDFVRYASRSQGGQS